MPLSSTHLPSSCHMGAVSSPSIPRTGRVNAAQSVILRERPHSYNCYYSILLQLFYFILVIFTFLLCLSCKLNFILGICVLQRTQYYSVLSVVSGVHWGSWHVCSADKRELLYYSHSRNRITISDILKHHVDYIVPFFSLIRTSFGLEGGAEVSYAPKLPSS